MIAQRTKGLQKTLLVAQGLLALVLLVLSEIVAFSWLTSVTRDWLYHNYPIYALLVVVGLMLESAWRSSETVGLNLFNRGIIAQHQVALRQVVFAVGTLLCYLALNKDQVISRSFLLVYVPVLYLGLLTSNLYLPRWLAGGIFRGVREARVLLIGPLARVAELRKWAREKEVFGIELVGLLHESAPVGEEVEGLRCLGRPSDLEGVLEGEGITQVLMMELPRSQEAHRGLVVTLERMGVRLLIHSNLEELLGHPVVHVEDAGLRFITLREEPLENPFNQLLKRTLDLVVALPVVVLLLPPLAFVVWLAQRWQSPGPLLFRQQRAGIQNLEFTILKFRTMEKDNPEESRQATSNDRRVYPAGRWLRRLSLDEVPQFLNVLRGDMSVIGPRPHLLEHNAQFAQQMANYHIRAYVKPGITGLAQVRGFRGEVCSSREIAHRLESDITYLENWRLALDLGIIARTAWQMLQPSRNAY